MFFSVQVSQQAFSGESADRESVPSFRRVAAGALAAGLPAARAQMTILVMRSRMLS
jgi:hypothetical protein